MEVKVFCFVAVQGLVHQHVPFLGEAPLLDTVFYKGAITLVVCLICECIGKCALQPSGRAIHVPQFSTRVYGGNPGDHPCGNFLMISLRK